MSKEILDFKVCQESYDAWHDAEYDDCEWSSEYDLLEGMMLRSPKTRDLTLGEIIDQMVVLVTDLKETAETGETTPETKRIIRAKSERLAGLSILLRRGSWDLPSK